MIAFFYLISSCFLISAGGMAIHKGESSIEPVARVSGMREGIESKLPVPLIYFRGERPCSILEKSKLGILR
jgi:hypothetical protein